MELVIRQGVKRSFEKAIKSISFISLINTSSYGEEVVYYIMNRARQDPMAILEEMTKLDERLKQEVMSGLQRVLKEKELEGIRLGKLEGMQLGEQRGEQKGISSILELVRQGHIDQSVADKILKEKFGVQINLRST